MKMKLSELAPGSCFRRGKRSGVRKKLPDGRVLTISEKNGKKKKRIRAIKGDPAIESAECPLDFLGEGLRKTPDSIVEIGSREMQRRRRGC